MSEMDWQEFENFPPTTSEIAIQTDPIVTPKIETAIQTDPILTSRGEIATQTDPIQPSRGEIATQTEPFLVPIIKQEPLTQKRKPKLQMSNVTQTSYVPERPRLQTTATTQHYYLPDPPIEPPIVRKKIIPTQSISTQTVLQGIPKRSRKKKNPKKIVTNNPLEQQQQLEQALRLARELSMPSQSRAMVPLQTRELLPTAQRNPTQIVLSPEMRQQFMQHYLHYGQPVFPQSQSVPQRSLTYVPRQADRTRQEYPLMPAHTREVNLPESMYVVETPSDEPPGQREATSTSETVPPFKILKKTFKSKKSKQKFQPTQILNRTPEEEAQLYQQINLPSQKQLWSCDICGAFLSSKYNLERHQIRERKKLAESGSIPSEDFPMEEGMQRFQSWVQIPAKRTATDAKLTSKTYRKRATKEKKEPIAYDEWANPNDS